MYNKQLDVFIKTAELGSFSRAAQALFITPSAVIQQVNGLEERLGVQLFERSRKGIALTAAGAHLLAGGRDLIERSNRLTGELRAMDKGSQRQLTLGVGLLHRARLVYELWNGFLAEEKEYRLNVIGLKAITNSAQGFVQDADVIEGLDDAEPWQKGWAFTELCRVPLACAVPKAHPLAQKNRLTLEDLKGCTMFTIRADACDRLCRFVEDMSKAGVDVQLVDIYGHSLFSRCVLEGCVLQTPMCWHDIHPDLVTIPCEWGYELPYGLWHKPQPSPAAARFLQYVRGVIEDEAYVKTLQKQL